MDNLFQPAFEEMRLVIKRYSPEKTRPIVTTRGNMNMDKLRGLIISELIKNVSKFAPIIALAQDDNAFLDAFEKYVDDLGLVEMSGVDPGSIPEGVKLLTLNLDQSINDFKASLFCTRPDETVDRYTSGYMYTLMYGMDMKTVMTKARKVVREYFPRNPPGIIENVVEAKSGHTLNSYIPPKWVNYPDMHKLPDRLPLLFEKLVNHLFPLKIEREYFYAWAYASLFERAYVFLILCGAPATGKNRLKLVMRALHGYSNTVDGKKSSIDGKFNKQYKDNTLLWFDEIAYKAEHENNLKELQNDSISIEGKGVDSTNATPIYLSVAMSNNKPRDNYIAFDARKFAPLVINDKRLEHSMTPDQIDKLSKKVQNEDSPEFDLRFVAQIAKWIQKHGKSDKWPNLEYRGPMFWQLAHTSMTRVQKKIVMLLGEAENRTERMGYDEKTNSFLWSVIHEKSYKKNGDKSLQLPDFTSARVFLEVFRDSKGEKVFRTEPIKDNIMDDFRVFIISDNLKVVTELSLMEQREKNSELSEDDGYDI